MSLSDCPRCWDTPCTCGFNVSDKVLAKHQAALQQARRAERERCAQYLEDAAALAQSSFVENLLRAHAQGLRGLPDKKRRA